VSRACAECNAELDPSFRFCPHCGRAQRTKIVEWFRGDRRVGEGTLRVSVYLTEPQHARFSIWHDGVAQAAVSLDPAEAAKLAGFLSSVERRPARRSARSLVRLHR
jgi:zinc ribbon protein